MERTELTSFELEEIQRLARVDERLGEMLSQLKTYYLLVRPVPEKREPFIHSSMHFSGTRLVNTKYTASATGCHAIVVMHSLVTQIVSVYTSNRLHSTWHMLAGTSYAFNFDALPNETYWIDAAPDTTILQWMEH